MSDNVNARYVNLFSVRGDPSRRPAGVYPEPCRRANATAGSSLPEFTLSLSKGPDGYEGQAGRTVRVIFLASLLFLIFSYVLYQQRAVTQPHCDIDSGAYIQNGLLFYQKSSFAEREHLPYYTLGYPFVIGLLYKLCGAHNWAVIFFQIFLTLMSGFLIFVIARRLFNQTVAVLSFIFFAFNLGFLVFAQFILTETLLVFFLLLFTERLTLYFSVRTHSTRCLRQLAQGERLITAGLFLGCSVIIKPAALYYPVLLLPLFFLIRHQSWLQKSMHGFFFVCAFFFPIFGYMTHNYFVFNQFKLSSLDEINLLIWFLPNVLAEKNGTDNRLERQKIERYAAQDMHGLRTLFWTQCKESPALFAYVWLKNVLKTFVGLFSSNLKVLVRSNVHGGDSSFFKTKGSLWQRINQYVAGGTTVLWVKVVAWLEVCWSIIRYFFVCLAFLFLLRKKRYVLLYFFSSYFFYFSFITGHDGCARFRMMFEWLLIILVSVGVWVLWELLVNLKCVKKKRE